MTFCVDEVCGLRVRVRVCEAEVEERRYGIQWEGLEGLEGDRGGGGDG